MAWGDVNLLQETDGTEYLEYTEWQTKSRSVTQPRNTRTIKHVFLPLKMAFLKEIQFLFTIFMLRKGQV